MFHLKHILQYQNFFNPKFQLQSMNLFLTYSTLDNSLPKQMNTMHTEFEAWGIEVEGIDN